MLINHNHHTIKNNISVEKCGFKYVSSYIECQQGLLLY